MNATEADFRAWAEAQGWRVTKQGWPDFICRRGAEVMAVEVKGGNDGVRPEQAATIADLRAAGLPTFVWWPERGLLSLGGVAESVATLKAENDRLKRLLAEAVGFREKVPTVRPPSHPSITGTDEITRVLITMSNECIRQHPEHQQWYQPAPGGLSFCGWLLFLSTRLTQDELVEVTGLTDRQIRRSLPKVQRWAAHIPA